MSQNQITALGDQTRVTGIATCSKRSRAVGPTKCCSLMTVCMRGRSEGGYRWGVTGSAARGSAPSSSAELSAEACTQQLGAVGAHPPESVQNGM